MADESRYWAAGSYLFFILSGIAVYILREKDDYSRFHAMQSMLMTVALFVISFALGALGIVLGFIPFVKIFTGLFLGLVSLAVSVVAFVLWLFMMWKAYSGERYRIPLIGEQAEQLMRK